MKLAISLLKIQKLSHNKQLKICAIYYTPGMDFLLFSREIIDGGLLERISEKVYL